MSSNTTIIRALSNQRVLTVSGASIDNSVIISGLAFTGGRSGASPGGGVMLTGTAAPLLSYLVISDNQSGFLGGGLYVNDGSSLTLVGTSFISNSVTGLGGGAYVSDDPATVTDSYFESNKSSSTGGGFATDGPRVDVSNTIFMNNVAGGSGGGMVAEFVAMVNNSRFENNRCTSGFCSGGGIWVLGEANITDTQFISNSASGSGGGVRVSDIATITGSNFENNSATSRGGGLDSFLIVGLFDTVFTNNTAGEDGGGASARGALFISRTAFISNSAVGNGGGIAHDPLTFNPQNGSIINTLFARNTTAANGAALYVDTNGLVEVIYTTIVDTVLNSDAGIYVDSGAVSITNTIVTSHAIGIENVGGTVNEDYNLFFDNTTNLMGTFSSSNAISGMDPVFVNTAVDNYHLGSGSAALDNALDLGIPIDLDGNLRPVGDGPDRGAYEMSGFTIYLPIVVRNN